MRYALLKKLFRPGDLPGVPIVSALRVCLFPAASQERTARSPARNEW